MQKLVIVEQRSLVNRWFESMVDKQDQVSRNPGCMVSSVYVLCTIHNWIWDMTKWMQSHTVYIYLVLIRTPKNYIILQTSILAYGWLPKLSGLILKYSSITWSTCRVFAIVGFLWLYLNHSVTWRGSQWTIHKRTGDMMTSWHRTMQNCNNLRPLIARDCGTSSRSFTTRLTLSMNTVPKCIELALHYCTVNSCVQLCSLCFSNNWRQLQLNCIINSNY